MTANNLPPRLYYRLDEAAQLLGCTKSDLLHRAMANELLLLAYVSDATGEVAEHSVGGGSLKRLADIIRWGGFTAPKVGGFELGDELKSYANLSGAAEGWLIPAATTIAAFDMRSTVRSGDFYYVKAESDLVAAEIEDSYRKQGLEKELSEAKGCWVRLYEVAIKSETVRGLHIDSMVIPSGDLKRLLNSHAPKKPAENPEQPASRQNTKTLSRQRAFAEQLGQLFGRAVSADDSREPMTIVMELLEGSKYARMIHSPYELHTALVYLASRPPSEHPLCISDEALARWIKAHTQHSQHSQHSPHVGHGIKKP